MALAPTIAPAPDAVASLAAIAVLHGAIDDVAAADSPPSAEVLRQLDRAISRLHGVRLQVVARADRDGVAAQTGLSDTAAWVATTTRSGGGEAARDLRLATALDDGLSATRTALDRGDLTPAHARVIADTTARLPERLAPEQVVAIEKSLVAKARLLDPTRLRRVARRATEEVERDLAAVDAHEDTMLRADEDAAYAKTRLTWFDHGDGTTTGHFTLPTLAASILIKAVQQIASPRRFGQRATAKAKATGVTGAKALADARWNAFAEAEGDWAHRYGTAFLELIEHLPTERLHGKVAATVVVTIDHDRLRAGVGAGTADTGVDLSAREVRRLACGSGVLPAVLIGDSLPLDLGRTERFYSEHQRVALATKYTECAATGCDRPYAWSELHHEDPWSREGLTDLALAVPLCGHHHRRAHDPKYAGTITTDDRGIKTVSFRLRT